MVQKLALFLKHSKIIEFKRSFIREKSRKSSKKRQKFNKNFKLCVKNRIIIFINILKEIIRFIFPQMNF